MSFLQYWAGYLSCFPYRARTHWSKSFHSRVNTKAALAPIRSVALAVRVIGIGVNELLALIF